MSLKAGEKATANDFYEEMMRPDAPDEMAFQLNRDKPGDPVGMTFSQEAINEVAEQFRMFLMARVYGQMQRTGIGPRHLRATVKLDWAPGNPLGDASVGPFYEIANDQGITPVDGKRRTYKWRKA